MTEENALAHYGVLGMKWGVRKDRMGKLGAAPRRAQARRKAAVKKLATKVRPPASEDHAIVKNLGKKPASSLSNTQLRELNNRLQLEQNYKQLQAKRKSEGQKMVEKVLKDVASRTVSEYIGKGLDEVMKKAK